MLHTLNSAQSHHITPLTHTMASKARKLKAAQSKVFTAVEGNQKLLDLLEIATSTSQKVIFIESLLEILPTAFDHSDKMNPEELLMSSLLGLEFLVIPILSSLVSLLLSNTGSSISWKCNSRNDNSSVTLAWIGLQILRAHLSPRLFLPVILLGSPHVFPRLRLSIFQS